MYIKQLNQDDLGDTANDIATGDSLALIVVNGSDKIEVVDKYTFHRIATIIFPAGSGPVHITDAANGDFYVSTLYGHKLYRIDGESLMITDSVQVGLFPDEVLFSDNKIFVSNSGFGSGNTVSVIGAENMQILATIVVGFNPQGMDLDPQGRVHVICTGNTNQWEDPNDDVPGGIWVINPQSQVVEDSLNVAATFYPGVLSISGSNEGYFIYQNNIIKYDTKNLEISDNKFIEFAQGETPYNLYVEDVEKSLYVLDARDYISPGELIIVNLADLSMERFGVGIIPGSLAFRFQ